MNSISVRVFCLLLLAGAVGGVFAQRNSLSKLQALNGQLRQSGMEIQRLTSENAEIDRLRAEVQEIEQLRNETRELHKLRNDVRQLREQRPEWDKLRAENQRLQTGAGPISRAGSRAPDPANLIAKELLSDAGLRSPEATLQTLFWAMREGNLEKMRSCFMPDTPGQLVPGGSSPMMAGFKGFRVVAKKVVSTDEVRLGIQLSADQEAAPDEWVLPFKRVEGEWKVNLAPSR